MPTVLRVQGYRIFFYSNERNEPPHVHVEKGNGAGKWWLSPVRMANQRHFTAAQLRAIHTILTDHKQRLLEAWHEYHAGN